MDSAFFMKLNNLNKNERYWIATLFLKVIFADERIDRKEVPYLRDVFDLLDNNTKLIQSSKKESKQLSVEKCTHILIGYNLTEQLLICLLEICICDNDFDDRELVTVGEIASEFGYEADRFEGLVLQVKNNTQD